jgi:hypothetical protein
VKLLDLGRPRDLVGLRMGRQHWMRPLGRQWLMYRDAGSKANDQQFKWRNAHFWFLVVF